MTGRPRIPRWSTGISARAAYLESDKAENLPLFGHFGFEVEDRHVVLDTPVWFMLRAAKK